ncbi:hypothetical protein LI328DRAFT_122937 [Trichoderma asperelloides]|nr:hypothetical protein LI328DRAFT_122937 [Trichoderma asperelloides]
MHFAPVCPPLLSPLLSFSVAISVLLLYSILPWLSASIRQAAGGVQTQGTCTLATRYLFPGKTRLAGFNRHPHAVLPPPPQDAFSHGIALMSEASLHSIMYTSDRREGHGGLIHDLFLRTGLGAQGLAAHSHGARASVTMLSEAGRLEPGLGNTYHHRWYCPWRWACGMA